MAADERKYAQEQLAYLKLLLDVHEQATKTSYIKMNPHKFGDATKALLNYVEHEMIKIMMHETYKVKL